MYLSEYLTSRAFPDVPILEYGLIGGLNFSVAMLLAPLATLLSRELGTRVVMFLGRAIQGSGYIVASFATTIWHLYLSQGLMVGCGIGFLIIPSTAVLCQ